MKVFGGTRLARIGKHPIYVGVSQRVSGNKIFVVCFVLGLFVVPPLLVWLLRK